MTATDTDAGATMSLDELRAHQLANLKTTVTTVYEKVPHYRKAFDDLGVVPSDITSLDDIAKLPFTNKQDLRENYPFGLFAVPREDVARIHASSGTTGLPTVVGYTQNDLDVWSGLIKRSILGAGGRPGQMLHNAYGYGLFTGGLGVHGAERHASPSSRSPGDRQNARSSSSRTSSPTSSPPPRPTCSRSSTSSTSRASTHLDEPQGRHLRRRTVDGRDAPGDRTLLRHRRRRHLRPLRGHGPRRRVRIRGDEGRPDDLGGPLLPRDRRPLHRRSAARRRGGRTRLHLPDEGALPIIRYRTHDLASLLPGTAHPNFRRISRITGRSDDLIIIRGVNVYPANVESVLFEFEHLSPHFQLVLTRPGRMDEVTVEVECREGVDAAQREGLGVRVASRIKERLGVSSTVDVKDPGACRARSASSSASSTVARTSVRPGGSWLV